MHNVPRSQGDFNWTSDTERQLCEAAHSAYVQEGKTEWTLDRLTNDALETYVTVGTEILSLHQLAEAYAVAYRGGESIVRSICESAKKYRGNLTAKQALTLLNHCHNRFVRNGQDAKPKAEPEPAVSPHPVSPSQPALPVDEKSRIHGVLALLDMGMTTEAKRILREMVA